MATMVEDSIKPMENEDVDKEGKDYTGMFFSVRFYVNKTVELMKVGFVGVSEKSECNKFLMGIEILQEVIGVRRQAPVLYPLKWHPVTGEKGKEFFVKLERPVLIPVNCDVLLRFQVKELGNDEHSKVRLNCLKKVKPIRITHKGTKVEFIFGNSSAAWRVLYFRAIEQ